MLIPPIEKPRLILGLLSLGSTGSSASAKLQLLSQDKPVMLAGALRQDNGEFILKSGSGEQAYRLGLICQEDNRLAVTLRCAALLLAVASDGRSLQEGLVQGSAQGRYSLRLQALGTGEGQPADPGLAMGLLQAKGRLDVAGRLGDGSSITGSLNLDAALAYRMLILPHSAAKAWLGGQWSLQAPADGNSSWGAQSVDLLWRRGPHPKDQRYPQGLGPLPLHLDMRR